MADHVFISYSTADALEFARRLADELEGRGDEYFDAWLDKRDIDPARDWDDQLVEGIKTCKCMVFVMSKDSTAPGTMCKNEWTWALKYKKLVIPIRYHKVEQPFGLGNRQWIDFTGEFEHGMAQLRMFLRKMDSPEGILQALKDRLSDAERDLRRAKGDEENRIKAEIEDLKSQIQVQQRIVDDPEGAKEQTQKNIEAGLERERQPVKPTAAQTSTKFINPPPGIAPNYFQDRMVETEQVVKFLQDDSQRMMTIIGRGGVGKTAMVCRLLKGLEGGELPDGLGRMRVEGIVYLSESGSHRVNFANLFYDLCKLLPADAANALDAVYKNPQASTASKMSALLDRFTAGKVVLLLDNVEPLISVETFDIADAELDECLRALLHGAHSALKVILTTRVAPRGLNLCEPGRQRVLTLDSGLEQKYAVEMLREMDVDGKLGLKAGTDEALGRACERTLGFPRALEALFAILASDRYTTLDELLAMPTPVNVVEALVGEAFNRLDTNAQKVMQALAVYNRPVTPAAVDYLLAPHIPAMDSAPILQRLANMHFARKESGRFYLHPVDREFAFGLIPVGENREQRVESSDSPSQNPAFRRLLSNRLLSSHLAFTQHDLVSRAADYFAQARKPRTEWKKLDDLSAQLAEFDLRCVAGDYDSATNVLKEISFYYLFLWGHYHLLIGMYEKVVKNIQDLKLRLGSIINLANSYSAISETKISIKKYEEALILAESEKSEYHQAAAVGGLGNVFSKLGDIDKAVECFERALKISREIRNRTSEGISLGNLGICYEKLGNSRKAIEFYEQSLLIFQAVGARNYVASGLINLGNVLLDTRQRQEAEESYRKSIQIADELILLTVQQNARSALAESCVFQNDLVDARIAIEDALQYDVPENNYAVRTLHGIIALRQGDKVVARGAFVRAIGQADEILSKTAEYYSALDAKGLAKCGLLVIGNWRLDGERDKLHAEAIETFRKAREIAPHAGVVKRVLRLFDELVKCDHEGILKDVRSAAAGSE